jgi:hypothetical protein
MDKDLTLSKCVNCGKQVFVSDDPDDICYWCKKPAKKKVRKEDPVNEKAQVDVNDLSPEALAQLGEKMPPKPDISALPHGKKISAMHDYYKTNEQAIKADGENLGEDVAQKKWGISDSGWTNMRARLWPDKYKKPKWKSGKKDEEEKNSGRNLSESDALMRTARLEIEVAYLRGWYDNDMARLRAGRL